MRTGEYINVQTDFGHCNDRKIYIVTVTIVLSRSRQVRKRMRKASQFERLLGLHLLSPASGVPGEFGVLVKRISHPTPIHVCCLRERVEPPCPRPPRQSSLFHQHCPLSLPKRGTRVIAAHVFKSPRRNRRSPWRGTKTPRTHFRPRWGHMRRLAHLPHLAVGHQG